MIKVAKVCLCGQQLRVHTWMQNLTSLIVCIHRGIFCVTPGEGDSLYYGLGGGEVNESTDGRGCAILALEVVPKNLIST